MERESETTSEIADWLIDWSQPTKEEVRLVKEIWSDFVLEKITLVTTQVAERRSRSESPCTLQGGWSMHEDSA